MKSIVILTNGHFPNHPTPLHNLNEEFLENISHGKILMYQVYK